MEFGPRALGARSILANPTDPSTKDTLNAKIKHREAFRPFAPSTLIEAASTYFDFGAPRGDVDSPFMLLTARVRPDKQHLLPAITHLDGTARVQTVSRSQNPLYYALIEEFGKLTGVPVLVNTSFNVNGEPIVCTPAEAFNSFAHTDMDYLVMGNALIPASSKRQLAPTPGRPGPRRRRGGRLSISLGKKVVAIALPWVFLIVFASLYILLALPRVRDGHPLAICLGAFVALVFTVFFVAAITFSRDVVLNRWPEPQQ